MKASLSHSVARPLTVVSRSRYASLIVEHEESPLSSVIAHRDVDCITRYFAAGAFMHLATHRISDAEPAHREYTDLHVHAEPELNVIIPDESGLVYRIGLGDEEFVITRNSSVWIPPGVPHSANVISGSGHFVALRINSNLDALRSPPAHDAE